MSAISIYCFFVIRIRVYTPDISTIKHVNIKHLFYISNEIKRSVTGKKILVIKRDQSKPSLKPSGAVVNFSHLISCLLIPTYLLTYISNAHWRAQK